MGPMLHSKAVLENNSTANFYRLQGPSMNHFGIYLLEYKSSSQEVILQLYYPSKCSIFLFCRNPKNDQIRAKNRHKTVSKKKFPYIFKVTSNQNSTLDQ